jgi:hypothetical protein
MANAAGEKKPQDRTFIEEALKRFMLAQEAETEIRREALDDLKFLKGDQWPDEIKSKRAQRGRPCLVINRLAQFVNQVTNDQRQNRPGIKVSPVNDDADEETAEIIQGLIRHIEYDSGADAAYDTAFEGAAGPSFGYFRIITEYCDPMSFDQDIKIKRIANPFLVYLDPASKEPDGSDAAWGFIFEDLPRDTYKELYPDSELATLQGWDSIGDRAPQWVSNDSIRVAEYFYKDKKRVEICLMVSPEGQKVSVPRDKVQEAEKKGFQYVPHPKTGEPQCRWTETSVVKWCKHNAVETLEETELPGSGKYIPIVPVYGKEIIVDGRKSLQGLVRNAKDPARQYNYWATAGTETIALAPRAPFIGAEGQFEGREQEWAQANTENLAFLQYKPLNILGQPAPPPQRNVYEPPIRAITEYMGQSAEDLKATTGIYDPTLGRREGEQSGIAIRSLQNQGQTSNFHLVDNFHRSLRHAGRIILDWIPDVYDTPERVIRTIGEDGTHRTVTINGESEDVDEQGLAKVYDLTVGKYDIVISTGPSYQTKRQEAVAWMQEALRAAPELMNIAGDLLFRMLDLPGAEEFAERMRMALPPAIQQQLQQKEQGGPAIPPQIQGQMQALAAQHDQLVQAVHVLKNELDSKEAELRLKWEEALLKAQTQVTVAEITAKSSEAKLAFSEEMKEIQHLRDVLAGFMTSQAPGAGAEDNSSQDGGGGAGGAMPTSAPAINAQIVPGPAAADVPGGFMGAPNE